jgi:hypothetical protein
VLRVTAVCVGSDLGFFAVPSSSIASDYWLSWRVGVEGSWMCSKSLGDSGAASASGMRLESLMLLQSGSIRLLFLLRNGLDRGSEPFDEHRVGLFWVVAGLRVD